MPYKDNAKNLKAAKRWRDNHKEFYLQRSRRPEVREMLKNSAARRRQRMRAFVDWLKTQPCLDCGGIFPPVAMDFDHRDTTTKIDHISHMRVNGCRLDKIQAELAKCDVVCANCHRVRTMKQRVKS